MKTKQSVNIGLLVIALILTLLVIPGCSSQQKPEDKAAPSTADSSVQTYVRPDGVNADQAKQLLVEGNERFVSGKLLNDDVSNVKRDGLVKNGQKPLAVIVTCSDSRVPPELLFDQGLGDIFIIRTAGNVADAIATGSVEYGVEHLKAPLLVVMGHSSCGAVKATVDGGEFPGSIPAIAAKIKPSVDKVKAAGAAGDAVYQKSEDENVKAVVADLEKSPVVKELVEEGKLKVVGAKYHLDSGKVEWLQ